MFRTSDLTAGLVTCSYVCQVWEDFAVDVGEGSIFSDHCKETGVEAVLGRVQKNDGTSVHVIYLKYPFNGHHLWEAAGQ